MRFKIKTKYQRLLDNNLKLKLWFAWKPTRLNDTTVVWLGFVYRQLILDDMDDVDSSFVEEIAHDIVSGDLETSDYYEYYTLRSGWKYKQSKKMGL